MKNKINYYSLILEDQINCLIEMINNTDDFEKIKMLKERSLKLNLKIYNSLILEFITPIEREDIYNLSIIILKLTNYIYSYSSIIYIFKLDIISNNLKQLIKIVLDLISFLKNCVNEIFDVKTKVLNKIDINIYINDFEDLYSNGYKELLYSKLEKYSFLGYNELYLNLLNVKTTLEELFLYLRLVNIKNN